MSIYCCPKYPVLRSSLAWKREVRNQTCRFTCRWATGGCMKRVLWFLGKNRLDKLLQLTPWTLESTSEDSNRVGETSNDVCNTHKIRCWESLPTPPPHNGHTQIQKQNVPWVLRFPSQCAQQTQSYPYPKAARRQDESQSYATLFLYMFPFDFQTPGRKLLLNMNLSP